MYVCMYLPTPLYVQDVTLGQFLKLNIIIIIIISCWQHGYP